jgi:hypothetical protein
MAMGDLARQDQYGDLDPWTAAATRFRAKYADRAELGRRQATPSADYDPKYLQLPASENVDDRTNQWSFDPLYQFSGFNLDKWKQAWDYLRDPEERARVTKAVELARVTPGWRQRVPDDLSGDLPRQIGFYDIGSWHTGGIGSR